jgi:hypothetical protein
LEEAGLDVRHFALSGLLVESFCVSAPPEEGAWLEAADGKRHPIKGSCSLGRTAANTVVLQSPKVSRRHALIHLQNIGELWLIDFGSSNGTFPDWLICVVKRA